MTNIKTIASPPFTVRNAKTVNAEMGPLALPHGYTAAPEVTFTNPSINDECGWEGCAWPEETLTERRHDPAVYTEYMPLCYDVANSTRDALNLTQEEVDIAL
jgi:hypothetical protein